MAAAPDWSRVHADFAVNRDLIWLNNCGTTPTAAPVLATVKAHLDAYAVRSVFGVRGEWEVHDGICDKLAALLGADSDELAVVHNTTEAMTFISHGLPLASGDRILLLENEYPSNVYPWEHWRARGVSLDVVPLGTTPAGFLENFRAALRPETRVAAISAVHWCTGMPLPLAEIGAVCAERDIELVVDASQGLGMIPIDVRACQIGYLASSGWKWLLGPLGVGAMYIKRDRLSRLAFPFKGTGSVTNDDVYLPYRDTLKQTTARYVLSTPNFTDWIQLDASLSYLEALGFPAVMARIAALSDRLADQLRRRGFTLTRDAFRDRPTGIIAAERPGMDPAGLVTALGKAGVIAAARLGRLRLAPHVYLSEEQIDDAVARIGAC